VSGRKEEGRMHKRRMQEGRRKRKEYAKEKECPNGKDAKGEIFKGESSGQERGKV
jgi:hypothetical protein